MLQEQRLDMYCEMFGDGVIYLEAGKGEGIIKRIKDAIQRILDKIKSFFVKKKDPNEMIEVPKGAVKETKSFLSKAKKLLSNIGDKIKKHPKATVAALISLLGFSIATIWKKNEKSKILDTCKREECYNIIEETQNIMDQCNRELKSISDEIDELYDFQQDTRDYLNRKKNITQIDFDKAYSKGGRAIDKINKSRNSEIMTAISKLSQVVAIFGSLVSAIIVFAK